MLQRGAININDKIGKYLPEYSHIDVTIFQLATHTSGLQADLDSSQIHSNEDFEKQIQSIKLETKPGEKVVYSDCGYILLGFILEKISGKTLDKLAEEEVFKPLGMKNSTFYPDIKKCAPTELTVERGLVRGKTHDEKAYYSNKIIGHAGLFTNVHDLTLFAQMILNNGLVNDEVYLKKEYIDLWFHKFATDEDNISRGIGWIAGNTPNSTGGVCSDDTILHLGFTGTTLIIDRTNNLGIVVLTNRVHPTRDNRKLVTGRKIITGCVYKILDREELWKKETLKK